MINETNPELLRTPAGYAESTAPELFKFEKVGDTIEGLLVAFKREYIKGDEVLEVYIQTERGDKKVWANYDLKQKLRKKMLNKRVIIRYVGEDQSTAAKGNAMKVFKVWWRDPQEGDAALITDDDIPF